jgi:hypothetical protein
MSRFVEEADRGQWTLLPECLDDFIDESNPVRVIDVFVDALDLAEMRFEGVEPAATGRPSYHPSVLLKLYIYGHLNRVQSSRRLDTTGRIACREVAYLAQDILRRDTSGGSHLARWRGESHHQGESRRSNRLSLHSC